jgi:RNA polymerase sigma-70 factor
MEYLKRRYTREFRAALREALAALPREQREVLRLNFVHGLNIQAIGQRLNIHRATVARWISSARQAVFAETRRLLSERLKLAPSEFDSLLRMVRSQLDQSMAGLLGSQEAEPR